MSETTTSEQVDFGVLYEFAAHELLRRVFVATEVEGPMSEEAIIDARVNRIAAERGLQLAGHKYSPVEFAAVYIDARGFHREQQANAGEY